MTKAERRIQQAILADNAVKPAEVMATATSLKEGFYAGLGAKRPADDTPAAERLVRREMGLVEVEDED